MESIKIPSEYMKHGKVFSEEQLQRLPKHTIWDHAIELPFMSQAPVGSSSFHHSAMLPPLNPIHMVQFSRDNMLDAQNDILNGIQFTYGAFVSHISPYHASDPYIQLQMN